MEPTFKVDPPKDQTERLHTFMLINERVHELYSVIDFWQSIDLESNELDLFTNIVGNREATKELEDFVLKKKNGIEDKDDPHRQHLKSLLTEKITVPTSIQDMIVFHRSYRTIKKVQESSFKTHRVVMPLQTMTTMEDVVGTILEEQPCSSSSWQPVNDKNARLKPDSVVLRENDDLPNIKTTMGTLMKPVDSSSFVEKKRDDVNAHTSPESEYEDEDEEEEEDEDAWINIPGPSKPYTDGEHEPTKEELFETYYNSGLLETKREKKVEVKAPVTVVKKGHMTKSEKKREKERKKLMREKEIAIAKNAELAAKLKQERFNFVRHHMHLVIRKFANDVAFARKYRFPEGERMFNELMRTRFSRDPNDLLVNEIKLILRHKEQTLVLRNFLVQLNAKLTVDPDILEKEHFFISTFSAWFHINTPVDEDLMVRLNEMQTEADAYITSTKLDYISVYRLARFSIVKRSDYYNKNPTMVKGRSMADMYRKLSMQLNFCEFCPVAVLTHIDYQKIPTAEERTEEQDFLRTLILVLRQETSYGHIEFFPERK